MIPTEWLHPERRQRFGQTKALPIGTATNFAPHLLLWVTQLVYALPEVSHSDLTPIRVAPAARLQVGSASGVVAEHRRRCLDQDAHIGAERDLFDVVEVPLTVFVHRTIAAS